MAKDAASDETERAVSVQVDLGVSVEIRLGLESVLTVALRLWRNELTLFLRNSMDRLRRRPYSRR